MLSLSTVNALAKKYSIFPEIEVFSLQSEIEVMKTYSALTYSTVCALLMLAAFLSSTQC